MRTVPPLIHSLRLCGPVRLPVHGYPVPCSSIGAFQSRLCSVRSLYTSPHHLGSTCQNSIIIARCSEAYSCDHRAGIQLSRCLWSAVFLLCTDTTPCELSPSWTTGCPTCNLKVSHTGQPVNTFFGTDFCTAFLHGTEFAQRTESAQRDVVFIAI